MEWRDTGFVLATRRHGESALIVELLTKEHGRHAGLVRGGQSPRRRAVLQPGNSVAASWRGRLPQHLGTLECELIEAHAARFLDDPDRLAARRSLRIARRVAGRTRFGRVGANLCRLGMRPAYRVGVRARSRKLRSDR